MSNRRHNWGINSRPAIGTSPRLSFEPQQMQSGSNTGPFWAMLPHLRLQTHEQNTFFRQVLDYAGHVEGELNRSLGREHDLMDHTERLHAILSRSAYILILIDGNRMFFHPTFVRQGSQGGSRVAAAFSSLLTHIIPSLLGQNVQEGTRRLVRVFANLKAVTEACARAGIVDPTSKVMEFARGFTDADPLFDIVDTYGRTESVSSKVMSNFFLSMQDLNCLHVLLGCGNGEGYFDGLQQHTSDSAIASRLTLLEGAPFMSGFAQLPYRREVISGLFWDQVIDPINAQAQTQTDEAVMYQSPENTKLSATSDMVTPRSMTPGSNTQSESLPSAPSVATSLYSITSSSSAGMSWAQRATAAAAMQQQSPSPPKAKSKAVIDRSVKRNKAGQRVDVAMVIPDYAELQRIKKIKLCNHHYLGKQGCERHGACSHRHDYRATVGELKTLAVIARETVCRQFGDCDDEDCIYGHRCPFPPATEGSLRGIGCLHGAACRFPQEMHNMDMVVVKQANVTDT